MRSTMHNDGLVLLQYSEQAQPDWFRVKLTEIEYNQSVKVLVLK
jgi:hypothetical protein